MIDDLPQSSSASVPVIRKGNALALASYRLTLRQQQLLLLGIAGLNQEASNFQRVFVRIRDWLSLGG